MREVDVYLKRQKLRRVASQFAAYLGGDASTEFALPADSDIYGRSAAPLTTDEDYTVSVNGVNRAAPDVAADTVFHIGRFKQGTLLQAFSGVELLLNAGLGRYVSFGTPPDPVTASPLVVVDFKNGVYSVNGVTKTRAQTVVEDTAWAAYSSGDVIADTGLSVEATEGTVFRGPVLTALAASALLNGFVVLLEYTLEVSGTGSIGAFVSLELLDLPDRAVNEYTFSADLGVDNLYQIFDFEAAPETEALGAGPLHLSAIRVEDELVSMSNNGGAVQSTTGALAISGMTSVGLSVSVVHTGETSGTANAVLQKASFYAIDDPAVADLTTLSGA